MQEMQCEVSQASLFGRIHGLRRAGGVARLRGTDFDEDDAIVVECYNVKLAAMADVIARKDAIA